MTTRVAIRMRMPPKISRNVMDSPRIIMLRRTAVTGSSAPKMAVGVGPIREIAIMVKSRDRTVGNKARPSMQDQSSKVGGGVKLPKGNRAKKRKLPKNSW